MSKLRSLAIGFLTDSAWSLFASIAIKGLSLVSAILIARILGKTQFGIYGTVLSFAYISSIILTNGVNTAVSTFLPNLVVTGPKRVTQLLVTSTVLVLGAGFFVSISALFLAEPLSANVYHQPELKSYLLLASVLVFSMSLLTFGTAILQGFRLFKQLALRNALAGTIGVPTTLVLVSLYGVAGAIVASVVINVGNIILIWMATKRYIAEHGIDSPKKFDWSTAFQLLQFSSPIVAGGLLSIPIPWVLNTILARTHGFGEVGVFAAANNLASQIAFLTTAINVPLLPFYSELISTGLTDSLKRMFQANIRLTWIVTLTLAVFVSLNAPWLIKLLYGNDYESGEQVLRWMVISVMLSSVTNVLGVLILASRRVWLSFLVNSVWATTTTLSALLLIPHLGGAGTALSFVVGYFGHTILSVYVLNRWFKIGILEYKLVLASLVLFVLPFVVPTLPPIGSWCLFILFVTVLLLFVVTKVERDLLGTLVREKFLTSPSKIV